LLDAGEQSKAHEMFDRLLDQGQVNEHDLGRVMQACYSSTEMWKLASRVEEAGVPITSLTFNRWQAGLHLGPCPCPCPCPSLTHPHCDQAAVEPPG
jgi:hypothetical protein